jgi:tetratricopeptide (TPR) repeat protein
VSEELLTQRPELVSHQDRLARALEGLGVAGPLPAADSPFVIDLPATTPLTGRSGVDEAIELPPPPLDVLRETIATPETYEIDLSGDLEALLTDAPAPAISDGPVDPQAPATPGEEKGLELDDIFRQLRESSGRDEETAAAARAYDRASEHFNKGDREAAVACLREAVRDVSYRFRASSMLARLARERGDLVQAIDWLERAAQSPAPTLEASHAVLYELADTLQASGEPARALAVFLELQAIAPSFRDVVTRIGAASGAPSGGADRGRGPA